MYIAYLLLSIFLSIFPCISSFVYLPFSLYIFFYLSYFLYIILYFSLVVGLFRFYYINVHLSKMWVNKMVLEYVCTLYHFKRKLRAIQEEIFLPLKTKEGNSKKVNVLQLINIILPLFIHSEARQKAIL